MRRFGLCGLLIGTLVAATAAAQTVDVTPGRELATHWCADCHDIRAKPRPNLPGVAPSFKSIADDPAVTELALHVFHESAKEDMPNIVLTPQQSDEIAAYILSLRGQ